MSSLIKRILCVDDDRDTCELLEVVLGAYEFTAAQTLKEGGEFARTRAFDLYILDNWLPDGSGIDLCRQIRRADHNVPIVFLSGAAYQSDHEAGMGAGAMAYVVKPLNPLTFESTIARLIGLAEANSVEARLAEVAAIREAVADHLLVLAKRSIAVRRRVAVANDHLLKVQAYRTFTASGGTRAYFDRYWPEVLTEID